MPQENEIEYMVSYQYGLYPNQCGNKCGNREASLQFIADNEHLWMSYSTFVCGEMNSIGLFTVIPITFLRNKG